MISRTGRVQNWLDNPNSKLPVSCTTFVVEDSMEGPNGIEASWRFVSHALRNAAGCAVHLTKLRPKGDENGRGLTASGPVSFAKFYSTLNEVLRRGGTYKSGAVTLHLDWDHPDALEFVQVPRHELPWCKRCLDVDPYFLALAEPELIDAVLQAIKNGDLWLNKIKHDRRGERLWGNVCLEVYLPHRGTCLLQHVNLGACRRVDLKTAFMDGMLQLCELHPQTNVDASGEYLSPTEDRQVSLGVLGLANYLAQEGITYAQLATVFRSRESGVPVPANAVPAEEFLIDLQQAIYAAARVAEAHNMDRAFGIAPTASCSYRSTDRRGYTCCPEISPPVDRSIERDSGTFGVQVYNYPPDVEIATEVGWDTYKTVADGIVQLFRNTYLFHGFSFNSWSDQVDYDRAFLLEWLDSPQSSLYYALQVEPGTQAKDDALAALPEEFAGLYSFLAEEDSPSCFCSVEGGGCSE